MWWWAHRWLFSLKVWNSCLQQQFISRQSSTFKQRETSLLWWRHYAISINLIVGSYMVASTKTLKFISASLWNKKRQSIFKKREISLFWRSQYAISIPVIIGSLMSWLVLQNPRNTSQQKFIKETVAINIQINKNFLVLMTSSRRRHYRF